MLFNTLMTKCLIQRKRKNIYEKLSEAGRHRDVDWETNLEVLVLLAAPGELPHIGRNWAAVEYPQEEKE